MSRLLINIMHFLIGTLSFLGIIPITKCFTLSSLAIRQERPILGFVLGIVKINTFSLYYYIINHNNIDKRLIMYLLVQLFHPNIYHYF